MIVSKTARALALAAAIFAGCSGAHLYGVGLEDTTADRLGITGRVCTDDPRKAGFPVRVVLLVDAAMGPMFATFDVESLRLAALTGTLQLHSGNEDFSFAVVAYGANARQLTSTDEGWFTRNPGELDNAVATLGLPQGCIGGVCRDYDDGLDLAHAIIEGDLADLDAGKRGRTQYVVVMLTGGPPDPMVGDWTEVTAELSNSVIDLREEVEDAGALSFSMHTIQLAALNPLAPDPTMELDLTEDLMQQLALSGQGSFERFNTPDAITLERLGLLKLSQLLEAKSLIVTNASVLPIAGASVMDSDGDGLGDDAEHSIGTDHRVRDSDGDGIGDRIETLISLDPLVRDEVPNACLILGAGPWGDDDLDRLNDCEELLLGTDRSLPDTDGDAIPDWVEVTLGTDYIRSDGLEDADWDGAPNGTEALNHTDPRSGDANSHLSDSYRYDLVDLGLMVEPSVGDPRFLTGITVLDAGLDSSGGLGRLRYVPGDPPQMSWQDAQDDNPGALVPIGAAGVATLQSESELERWIAVGVDERLLPPNPGEEALLVEIVERHCIDYTVRNIKLEETDGDNHGMNDVFVYFAEAPVGQLTKPGLFRVAHIPVKYTEKDGRKPSAPLVLVKDEEFAPIGD